MELVPGQEVGELARASIAIPETKGAPDFDGAPFVDV
jgi:hypothetical protein